MSSTQEQNEDEIDPFISKIKQMYSSQSGAVNRPQLWSLLMGVVSGAGAGLSLAAKLPVYPTLLSAIGFAYTYHCFQQAAEPTPHQKKEGEEEEVDTHGSSSSSSDSSSSSSPHQTVIWTQERHATRQEGFLSGIGTSALLASGQMTVYRASIIASKRAAAAAADAAILAAANAAAATAIAQKKLSSGQQARKTTSSSTTITTPETSSSPVTTMKGSGGNPIAINMLLLGAASAIYYSGMLASESSSFGGGISAGMKMQ